MRWKEGCIRLKSHLKETGKLPDLESKRPLSVWLRKQTLDWTRLNDERLKLLWDLGVKFGRCEHSFIPRYFQVLEFREEHGHCRVTDSYDKKLAKWVRRIRQDRAGYPPSWIQRVDQLGFTWDVLEEDWQRHIEEFKAFVHEHGHAHVPKKYEKYPTLFSWVNNVRSGSNRTSKGRREELIAIGFDFDDWDTSGITYRDRVFEQRLEELYAFREKYGHFDVGNEHTKFRLLRSWLRRLRRDHSRYSTDQIELLKTLGVDLKREGNARPRVSGGPNYSKHLDSLRAFIAEFEHADVSFRNEHREYRSLANWIANLRKGVRYIEEPERAELESLGVRLED